MATAKTTLTKARNACYHNAMDTRKRLIQLKETSGLNWKAFAAYFDIPYRTMQDWYMGKRRMPEYLLRLMYYKMRIEEIIDRDSE